MFSREADLFFEDPGNYRAPPGDYGVLYLLRRDVNSCLGWNPTTGCRIPAPASWPGGHGDSGGG
jgi:hypothetical protein